MEAQTTTTAAGPALMTVREVASYLRISERFVYKLEASGALPCVRIGAAVRFRPDDVRAYVDRLARPPATVTPISGRDTIAGRD